jgi:hypothetical protein
MRKLLKLSVVVSLVAFAAGCGGDGSTIGKVSDDTESASYPAAVQSSFLKSCAANAVLVGGGDEADYEDMCGCALDELQSQYSLDEVTAAEKAMATGEATNIDMEAIQKLCGGGGDTSSSKVNEDNESDAYPTEVRNNFLRTCVTNAALSGGGEEADYENICGCLFNEVEARFTFEEFTAAEEAMTSGEGSGIDMEEIGKSCVD